MKVSVLGAGPAGSTAALYLAQAGVDVEIIDKVSFPREKSCAGGLFNPPLYVGRFPHITEIDGKNIFRVRFSCGRHSMDFTSRKPLMKTLLRKDLDWFLLQKAVQAGAQFSIRKKPEGEMLIDATGAKGALRYRRAGICMEYDFKTEQDIDTAHVHFNFGGIRGYAWMFPKKGHVNVGVGAYLPQRDIRTVYRKYLEYLSKNDMFNSNTMKYRSKFIPFAPVRPVYSIRTILAGDAAGFVNTSTGEGIFFAMLSGKLAAQTLIDGRDFSWYEKRCRQEFGWYLKPIHFIQNERVLRAVMERAIAACRRDDRFKKMIAENFFRLDRHILAPRFLKNMVL